MYQCPLYQKDPETDKYEPRVITKLLNNYRSHPEILHIPNDRFYDNELRVMFTPHTFSVMWESRLVHIKRSYSSGR